jgi:hypothetical protein
MLRLRRFPGLASEAGVFLGEGVRRLREWLQYSDGTLDMCNVGLKLHARTSNSGLAAVRLWKVLRLYRSTAYTHRIATFTHIVPKQH